MKRKSKNPAKFDRCVADVKKRARKSRKPVNAYAVCTAAGTRNNSRGKRRSSARRRNIVPLVGGADILAQQGPVLLTRVGKELKIIPAGRKNKKRPNAKGRKTPVKRGRTRKNPRRNPLEQSRQVFAEFHGRESDQTVKIVTPIHEHKYLAGIGLLEKLLIETPDGKRIAVTDFDGALLCQNEAKSQLFIEGGDQRVNVSDFGIRDPIHEEEVLGELVQVDYYTVKNHLGDEGGEAVYQHKLKSYKFRRFPTITYDTVNGLLRIVGGNYSILPEGIDN